MLGVVNDLAAVTAELERLGYRIDTPARRAFVDGMLSAGPLSDAAMARLAEAFADRDLSEVLHRY